MAGARKADASKTWRPQFYFGFRKFVQDVEHSRNTKSLEERKAQVYQEMDRAHLQKWVVFVAGVGFFSDAYDLFAVNTVIPMLQYAYADDLGSPNSSGSSQSAATAMLCATLAGTLIGQLIFGFLADRLGRRKMYGLELVILITATLGATMCAKGQGSMQILGWLVFWRFVMGVGVGGDYPLSAVITSEFAPKMHRARMLACVFLCQGLGQLSAMLVSLVITYLYRVPLMRATVPGVNNDYRDCMNDPACLAAVDSTWRWVIGLGAVPAVLAVLFRVTIPESPRFTLEVAMDHAGTEEVEYFFNVDDDESVLDDEEEGEEAEEVEDENRSERTAAGPEMIQRAPIQERLSPLTSADPTRLGHPDYSPRTSMIQAQRQAEGSSGSIPSKRSVPQSFSVPLSAGAERGPLVQISNPSRTTPQNHPPLTVRSYFWDEGNWRYLAGTAFSWLLLDFGYYGLGLNNAKFVAKVWPKEGNTVYSDLFESSTHSLVVVALGSIVGSLAMIMVVKHWSTKAIQFYGFIVLGILLFVLGTIMWLDFTGKIPASRGQGSLITLYVLCQIAFNLGPNTTTYMIPAEIFPTKYRASCHGISAAAGKLGGLIVQVFIAYVSFGGQSETSVSSGWLGHILQVFAGFSALGAVVTYYWVPETRDADGNPMSLEDLAKGWRYLEEVRKLRKNKETPSLTRADST